MTSTPISQALFELLGSPSRKIEHVAVSDLHAMFDASIVSNEWNQDAFNVHPAFGIACDYRDDGVFDGEMIQRLAAAIDRAYTADDLSVCNEGWGGIDGVTDAQDLIMQCYLFEGDPDASPELFQAMIDAGFMQAEDVADYRY